MAAMTIGKMLEVNHLVIQVLENYAMETVDILSTTKCYVDKCPKQIGLIVHRCKQWSKLWRTLFVGCHVILIHIYIYIYIPNIMLILACLLNLTHTHTHTHTQTHTHTHKLGEGSM